MEQEKVILNAEKKRTRAMLKVLVPITIIVVALTIIAVILANKAGNKTSVTGSRFAEISQEQGFVAVNVIEQLDSPGLFESAYITNLDDNNGIFFLEFKEKKDAKSYFANAARKFKVEVKEAGEDNSKQEDLENYCYYIATVNGQYMHVVRVKDTVLYAQVDEDHTKTVQKMVSEIGY